MELRQLEYLIAVAEEKSFTRAAARLYVAQPGVSAQIRRLEHELGQQLLDRSGREVRLTEAGAAVVAHARTVVDGIAGIRLTADEFAGLLRGRVSVGVVRSCPALDLPALLADFHKDHPAVRITLAEDNSDRLLEDVRGGLLDAAVVALTAATPPGVDLHVFVDEPLVIAVGADDRLAGKSTASVDALRDRTLASLPRGTGIRACLEEACLAAGFEPRVSFEVSDPTVLARLAARGLGPALLPASLAAEHPGDLHAIAVDPPLRGRMALAWRPGPLSPAARTFLTRARGFLTASATQQEPR